MQIDFTPVHEYIREKNVTLFELSIMTEKGIFSVTPGNGNPCNNSYSVSKAFAATGIGLLWDEGKIGLDEKVLDILKDERIQYEDANWEKVTVRNALQHKMGVNEGYLDIDVEDIYSYGTDDFLKILFGKSLPFEPGTHFQYTDAAYYLISRIVEARAGEKLDEYLMRKLMYPMRVQECAWSRCPKNHPMGATGLYIRSSDMVTLGFLYAMGGEIYGKRLLSEDWIREDQKNCFAFYPAGAGDLLGKGGMRGQMLMYSPNQKYAAAWHSYAEDDRASGLTEAVYDIMKG